MPDLKVALTPSQAAQLGALYEARQQADRAFVLYAQAVLGQTAYPNATLVGLEPQANGTPAQLCLSVPEAPHGE